MSIYFDDFQTPSIGSERCFHGRIFVVIYNSGLTKVCSVGDEQSVLETRGEMAGGGIHASGSSR
jgi:hypothetical protein